MIGPLVLARREAAARLTWPRHFFGVFLVPGLLLLLLMLLLLLYSVAPVALAAYVGSIYLHVYKYLYMARQR